MLEEVHGIELGHIFMLQQGYAKAMGLAILGEDGNHLTPWMGCYGIGTTRCVQAIIEQRAWRDDDGIIWPHAIAPYEVVIVPTNFADEIIKTLAERLHEELTVAGIEVVLDDREDRFGMKIKDADLIGYPLKLIIGRDAAAGKVEAVDRKTGSKRLLGANDLLAFMKEWREGL